MRALGVSRTMASHSPETQPSKVDLNAKKEEGQGDTFFLNLADAEKPAAELVYVLGGLYDVPYAGSYMGEFPMAELLAVVRGVARVGAGTIAPISLLDGTGGGGSAAAAADGAPTIGIPEEVKAALRDAGATGMVDFFFVLSSVEHILTSKTLYKKKSVVMVRAARSSSQYCCLLPAAC